eukprot:2158356-Alexandrium_andersonii.AAC.1
MWDGAAFRGPFWTAFETSTRLRGCRAHGLGVRRGLASSEMERGSIHWRWGAFCSGGVVGLGLVDGWIACGMSHSWAGLHVCRYVAVPRERVLCYWGGFLGAWVGELWRRVYGIPE